VESAAALARKQNLAERVVQLAKKIAADKADWNIAVDGGVCRFFYSPETSYSAAGKPLNRISALAILAARSKLPAAAARELCTFLSPEHYRVIDDEAVDARTKAMCCEIKW
jgi:hypothetical protein